MFPRGNITNITKLLYATSGEVCSAPHSYTSKHKTGACAALFARAKDLKQFKGPSLENWENKLWCLNKKEEDKDYIHMHLICIKRHWEESRETNECSSLGGSRKQGK